MAALATGAAAIAPQASTLPVSQPTTGGTTPPLSSYYAPPTAVSTFAASTGTAATVGTATTASASTVGPLASINSAGTINPNDSTNAASQLDAIRLGIARALEKFNPEFRATLKKAGLLTRDPREKERKKPGLKRARRAPQWAKR